MDAEELCSFKEDAFSIIDSERPDTVLFSPFSLFYSYLPNFDIDLLELLDDDGYPLLRQRLSGDRIVPGVEKIKTPSYTFHFTPKLYSDQEVSQNFSHLDRFYLLQDLKYPDYIGDNYKEDNCEVIMSYGKQKLYHCVDSR
ncbi:MAG: hypothetical protein ACLFNK_01375 [Candidatus Woesearchaeota archaeon]